MSELTKASNYATGSNFAPAGAAFNVPASLALDDPGNVFVTNFGGNSVSKLSAPGYTTGSNFAPAGAAFDMPASLAIDSAGNLFVTNCGAACGGGGNPSVSELTAASGYATGVKFAPAGGAFNIPIALAVDSAGNIFMVNQQGNSVSELVGLAQPVLTPTQKCLQEGHNVCLPAGGE